MAKPRKDGRSPNNWSVIIVRAAELAGAYAHPPSLRRIFYELVAEGTLPNTAPDYKALAHYTAEARRGEGRWYALLPDGFFPDLDDGTRKVDVESNWGDAADYAVGHLDGFRLDRDRDLPITIALGVEKRGLLAYMDDWFGELGFPRFAIGGYHSVPFEQELKRRLLRERRPAVILFAGDHDASGDDIFRNLVRRVGTGRIRFVRVALTREQVEAMGLISYGGKEDDTRWPAFAAEHGYDPDDDPVQVELDAVPLTVLRDLFAAAIADALDLDADSPPLADLQALPAFSSVLEEEETESNLLRRLREHWDEVVDFLDEVA